MFLFSLHKKMKWLYQPIHCSHLHVMHLVQLLFFCCQVQLLVNHIQDSSTHKSTLYSGLVFSLKYLKQLPHFTFYQFFLLILNNMVIFLHYLHVVIILYSSFSLPLPIPTVPSANSPHGWPGCLYSQDVPYSGVDFCSNFSMPTSAATHDPA